MSALTEAPYVRAALEANIVQLKARVRELTDEVEGLRSLKGRMSSETQEFVQYATEQLKQKDDIIKELGARLREIEYVKDAELRRLKQQMEVSLDSALSDQRQAEAELRERLRQSEIKIERAQSFLEVREKLETEISALQRELREQKEAYDAALGELERKYLIDKAALVKAQEAKVMELRRQAREEAQRALDADTTRVLIENQKMGEELALHSEETKILSKERLAMSEQARVLAREVEIYADKEKEWARQGVRKTQENRALTAKVTELETTLAAERRERSAEKSRLQKEYMQKTEDLRLQVDGMTSLLSLRNRELATVKRLAGIILAQRTDVEHFFLEALAQVKMQVAQRRAAAATAALEASRTSLERAGVRAAFVPSKFTRAHAGNTRGAPALTGAALTMMMPLDAPSKMARTSLAQMARDASATRSDGSLALSATTGGDGGIMSNTSLPPAAPTVSNRPVDLSELTPEDRERVLRLLFARIHDAAGRRARTAAPTDSVAPSPHHSDADPDSMAGPFGLSADIPDSLQQMELGSGARAANDADNSTAGPQASVFSTAASDMTSSSEVDTTVLAQALMTKVKERQALEEDIARTLASRPTTEQSRAVTGASGTALLQQDDVSSEA